MKAGLITCLFLWLSTPLSAQHTGTWLRLPVYRDAYNNCLQLKTETARNLLHGHTDPEAYALLSLSDALELMITEDPAKFSRYEPEHQRRLEALKKIAPATEKSLIALAEIRLQWAFVYLKFGYDFTAAWHLRQAHLLVQECLRKYPASVPILKTSALLEVMLGTVPDRYQWVLGLLGMKGSVNLGLDQLNTVIGKDEVLAFEAGLIRILMDGFIRQETDSAVDGIEQLVKARPGNRLLLFLGASLAIKNANGEMAFALLTRLKQQPNDGLPIPYAEYLQGEVYLHQGNYDLSIRAYQAFLKNYAGENFVKDANFKTGMAYWLSNRSADANRYMNLARAKGKAEAEADKYAAHVLSESTLPNIPLTKARYAIDGGYYDEAMRILRKIHDDELTSLRDKTEYAYRFARLYHQMNELAKAKEYYRKTIELSGTNPWYFAPNACLQLGYIFLDEHDRVQAKAMFQKALSYKKHEYKNSIDSKARSALAEISNQ